MIGLLGGTFNPIHLGHLSIAQDVLEYFDLESVEFLPCHTPVHRQSPSVSTAQRVEMINLALQDYSKFQISLCEIERGGSSYMIDTLQLLAAQDDQSRILILGTDTFNHLHQWKQAEKLFDYCHVVVCQRPNEECTQKLFNQRLVDDVSLLFQQAVGCLYLLNVKPVPCSSTEIREKLSKQLPVSQYLAQPVLEFIKSNELYESSEN